MKVTNADQMMWTPHEFTAEFTLCVTCLPYIQQWSDHTALASVHLTWRA